MTDFRLTIIGTTPLLMHNGQLADPLNEHAKNMKKISSKQRKTEEDHRELGRLEFLGGLYFDDHAGPYMPGTNIETCLMTGAKMYKLGTKVVRGLQILSEINPLDYRGPRDIAGLVKDKSFQHRVTIVINSNRVVRTRPIFHDWTLEVDGRIDDTQLELDQVAQVAEAAGSFVGLGDWRPGSPKHGGRFGKFSAKVEKL